MEEEPIQTLNTRVDGSILEKTNKALLETYFKALNQNRLNSQAKISNNIKALTHYYRQMFKKVVKSLKLYAVLPQKHMAFFRLRLATTTLPLRETDYVRQILAVHRKRFAIRKWHKQHIRKQYVKLALRSKQLQQNKALLQKYMRELKVATLLQKLGRRHQARTAQDAKYEGFLFLRKWSTVKKIHRNKRNIANQQYSRWILTRYLNLWRQAPLVEKFNLLKGLILRKQLKLFASSCQNATSQQTLMVVDFQRRSLLKRYFSNLFRLTVSMKVSRIYDQRILSKCFQAWVTYNQSIQNQIKSISLGIQELIRTKHKARIKHSIFLKFIEVYKQRQNLRNKLTMVQQYHQLKEVESLYRKYFRMLRLNVSINIAERHHAGNLISKSFFGLQQNSKRQKLVAQATARFKQKRLSRILRICFQELVKPYRFLILEPRMINALRTYKKCMRAWLEHVVTQHLHRTQKALVYQSLNLKFKVFVGLKQELRLSKLGRQVVKMRMKKGIRFMHLVTKYRTVVREERLRLLTISMRQWKLLLTLTKNKRNKPV